MGRIGQFFLLIRITDEGGFDQNGWDIGRFQHGETSLLYTRLVQAVYLAQIAEYRVAQLQAVVELGSGGSIEQNTGQLRIGAFNVHTTDQIRGIFLVGNPFCCSA